MGMGVGTWGRVHGDENGETWGWGAWGDVDGVHGEREHGDGVEDMEKVCMGIGVGDMGWGW